MRITSAGVTQLKPATGDLALEVFYGATSTGAMIGDASNFIIGGQTSKGLVFCTNNLGQEKMRITTGGSVGIGTSSPSEKLEVNGAIKTAAPSGGTAQPFKIGSVSAGDPTIVNELEVEINGVLYTIPCSIGTIP
jgi:hypothetical protein